MNNIHLSILGSTPFVNILNELEFNNILNPNNQVNRNGKKILIKILFAENLKIKEVSDALYLTSKFTEPVYVMADVMEYAKDADVVCLLGQDSEVERHSSVLVVANLVWLFFCLF